MQHGVANSGERFTKGVAVEDTKAVVCSSRKASCRDTTMTKIQHVCERENAHTGVNPKPATHQSLGQIPH